MVPRLISVCAGMDQAGTAFPASAAFLELPAFGVFWATGFALLAVAAVELQRHDFALKTGPGHNTDCTLEGGKSRKLLILCWGG